LVTHDINQMDCHKAYQPYGLPQLHKPHSTHKQVYTHAQRLGLQSARPAQRSKHNRTRTLPRFNSLRKAKRTHRGRGFKRGVVVDSLHSLDLKYRHIFKNGQQKKMLAKRPSQNGQKSQMANPKIVRPTNLKYGQIFEIWLQTANLATLL